MKATFFAAITASMLMFVSATVWEGVSSVATAQDRPGNYSIATNAFPRNSVVDITNLENGKKVRVIVSSGLETGGLLATLSRNAAEALNVRDNSTGRIRMSLPPDDIAFANFRLGPIASDVSSGADDSANSSEPDTPPYMADAANKTAAGASDAETKAVPQSPASAAGANEGNAAVTAVAENNPASPAATNSDAPAPAAVAHNAVGEKTAAASEEPAATAAVAAGTASAAAASAGSGTAAAEPAAVPSAGTPIAAATATGSGAAVAGTAAAEPATGTSAGTARAAATSAGSGSTVAGTAAAEPTAVPSAGTAIAAATSAGSGSTVAGTAAAEPAAGTSAGTARAAATPPSAAPVPARTASETRAANGTLSIVPSEERLPIPPSRVVIPPESLAPVVQPVARPETRPTAPASISPPAAAAPAPQFSPFQVPLISRLEQGKCYVQVGVYTRPDNVEDEVSRIGTGYPLAIQNVGTDTSPMFRVLLGPLNRGESEAMLQRFRSIGYTDAFVRYN